MEIDEKTVVGQMRNWTQRIIKKITEIKKEMGQAPGTSYTLAVPIHLFPLATFYIYADNKDWK